VWEKYPSHASYRECGEALCMSSPSGVRVEDLHTDFGISIFEKYSVGVHCNAAAFATLRDDICLSANRIYI
jgi:hypothetical protein